MAKEEEKEEVESVDMADENEPIYYKPKSLSLISTIGAWVSWILLLVFILVIIAQVLYIAGIAEQNSTTLVDFIKNDPSARSFVYTNLVLPLFTALGLFVLLQAAAIGLNALLEIDFNIREPKN